MIFQKNLTIIFAVFGTLLLFAAEGYSYPQYCGVTSQQCANLPSDCNTCHSGKANAACLDSDVCFFCPDDPSCNSAPPPQPEADCTDGTDNDGDGLVDCDDQDCQSNPDCQLPEIETDCKDKVDNDGDSFVDCVDSDCSADPFCLPEEDCSDFIDNDEDGLVDCDDTDCETDPSCQLVEVEDCTDGVDNDADGFTDCDDQNCIADSACQAPEPVVEDCTDGLDNDADGFTDCDDQNCTADSACQAPEPVVEDCTDGVDNDGDGFIDCADPDCATDYYCSPQEDCPQFIPPNNHNVLEDEDNCRSLHAPGLAEPLRNGCTVCHGGELTGPDSGGIAPSCFSCHGVQWEEETGNDDDTIDHAGEDDYRREWRHDDDSHKDRHEYRGRERHNERYRRNFRGDN